MSDKNVGQWI